MVVDPNTDQRKDQRPSRSTQRSIFDLKIKDSQGTCVQIQIDYFLFQISELKLFSFFCTKV